MDKREFMVVSAILTTLHSEGGSSPRAAIYLALEMDFSKYTKIESFLVGSGLVTVNPDIIRLTEAGTAKAIELEAIFISARNFLYRSRERG